MDTISVNDKNYEIIKLLGHGKGGYSYLVSDGEGLYVCKQIHHEPCSYYTFGDKLASELNDYKKLAEVGVNMPRMLEYDTEKERILKEYIDGDTVFDNVKNDVDVSEALRQVREIAEKLKNKGLNIDYYPTNFIMNNSVLYYVDYECNAYMEEWNFENWGIKYWSKTKEFLEILEKN